MEAKIETNNKASIKQLKELAQILHDALNDYEGSAWCKRSVLSRRDQLKEFLKTL